MLFLDNGTTTTPKKTTSSETNGIASRNACAMSCSSHSPFIVVTMMAMAKPTKPTSVRSEVSTQRDN